MNIISSIEQGEEHDLSDENNISMVFVDLSSPSKFFNIKPKSVTLLEKTLTL